MTTASRRYFELFNEIGIIAQLTRTIMEQRLPDGLSQPHFTVLNHLVRLGDGATPGQLAHAFQVPRNSMTNTLAGIEKRGLIELRPNPDDARSRHVFLTEAGRSFRERAIDSLSQDIARFAEKVPLQDIEAVIPAFAAMRKVLDENRRP
jgi:DNA-binding MarR family transcriptional regulator